MKLIAASNNAGKIAEIKSLASPYFDEITGLKEAGIDIDIEETGSTFLENALIKARAIHKLTNSPVMSDDSGLIVDALDGAPGIHSARYAGDHDDAKNNSLLLKNMETAENRRARFKSAVVLYLSESEYYAGEGMVEGLILREPRGSGGFGYDPLFYCPELGKGFGEASAIEKNTVSHRFRALSAAVSLYKASTGKA